MPLYLTEAEVAGLITAGDAVPVLEACFRRIAAGAVENVPRRRLALEDGSFAVMYAVDRELGYAGREGVHRRLREAPSSSSGCSTSAAASSPPCSRRTRPASGGPAPRAGSLRSTSRGTGARTLGVIGCGWQAESQVEAIRAAVPSIERVIAYCRTPSGCSAFCAKDGRRAGRVARARRPPRTSSSRSTTSRDPVLRGEWLREGALVCAVGANDPSTRELDNVVLERATFVCCDSREQARLESGDLIEPVAGGVLDWLEVHELQEVVSGELRGRETEADVVLFKSNGLAAWDVAIAARARLRARGARERGVGTTRLSLTSLDRARERVRAIVSLPIALIISGRSSSRARWSGLSRFWT